jgi:nicotinamidase-related amidase
MDTVTLINKSRPFLEWVVGWYNGLVRLPLTEVVVKPERTVVLAVDVLRGFCYEGPLSSPRVAAIVPPIVRLFRAAYDLGVRSFVLPQEAHPADAIEFDSYGPHCIAGTREAETVPELLELSFADLFVVVPKNSVNPFMETGLGDWLDAHPELDTYIVVGDCTDICTYQLAINLRLRANARQRAGVRVIVPADAADTYDLPVPVAAQLGAVPHDGDLLHLLFMYHLMLNGVQVVAGFE